jgi:F-type H+-transporting ATPase subunit gamma
MIQNLRQIKNRIRSVRNTRKITHAMEMVAAAKLNRIKSLFLLSRPYLQNMDSLAGRLLSGAGQDAHPLVVKREPVRSIGVCLMASDTGLCGPYNHNMIHFADWFLSGFDKERVRIIAVGKETYSHFSKQAFNITDSYLSLHGKYASGFENELTGRLTAYFMSEEIDEAYLIYMDFSSALRHRPIAERLLPVGISGAEKHEYILEPGMDEILKSVIPKYVSARIRLALLNTLTAEHSARMFAMKTATDNADELIGDLELARNKARQFAITKEVLEVAMSAEALKG